MPSAIRFTRAGFSEQQDTAIAAGMGGGVMQRVEVLGDGIGFRRVAEDMGDEPGVEAAGLAGDIANSIASAIPLIPLISSSLSTHLFSHSRITLGLTKPRNRTVLEWKIPVRLGI